MLKLLLECYEVIKPVLKHCCDRAGGIGCDTCQGGVGWGCICIRGGSWRIFCESEKLHEKLGFVGSFDLRSCALVSVYVYGFVILKIVSGSFENFVIVVQLLCRCIVL